MIDELRISNLGVIEYAHLILSGSMTAITGETGAGKTMALTSLALLMGERADTSRVRVGAERAVVEGTFVVAKDSPVIEIVENAGGSVDIDGDTAAIIIARHVPANGRSRAYVGGQAVPMAVLSEIADHLVTVHGQSDQTTLRSPARQREALDSFGGAELSKARAAYDAAYASVQEARRELDQFRADMREAASERLALEALVSRVDAVRPQLGEEDELRARALVLENVEDLRGAMAGAIAALTGGDGDAGALLALDSASQLLRQVSGADGELADYATQLANASIAASDVANELGVKLDGLDGDPDELNSIHQRRADLRTLQRDLGMGIAEIIERRESADARLATLVAPDDHLADLEAALRDATALMNAAGAELTAQRRAAAGELSARVTSELHDLAMKDATFVVRVEPAERATSHGMDDIAFLLSAHRGSRQLPLATSASGGEMSRIMLALETTLNANPRPDHTFIFDEVDAGIGGKTALRVGERLARLAEVTQVLTVTHLAQVAAYANQHVVVAKKPDADTTVTDVVTVEADERVEELARMLSGHEESKAARTHAAELIRTATVPR